MTGNIKHNLLSRVIFVHSKIDDAGLTANEFRVYCHLARRAGSGLAFPSVDTIAQVCRINHKTAWTVLAALEERNMVARTVRPGRSNLYTLTDPSEWKSRLNWVDPKEVPTQSEHHPEENGAPPGDPKGAPRRLSPEGYPLKALPRERVEKPKKQDFTPPTEQEWVDYCREKYPTWKRQAASGAWAYYESIGWRTKVGPIKNWKACAYTCKTRARPNELETQRYATPDELREYNEDFE